MTKNLKTWLASAGVAALLVGASAAQAANVPCPVGLGLEQCFSGGLFNTESTFSANAGTLTLGAGSWNLSGFFGANAADILGLSLVNGSNTMTSTNGLFSNIGAGTYTLKLSGNFTGAPNFVGGSYLATYGGGFDVKSAVPEPESLALLVAGLAAVGFVARRRQSK